MLQPHGFGFGNELFLIKDFGREVRGTAALHQGRCKCQRRGEDETSGEELHDGLRVERCGVVESKTVANDWRRTLGMCERSQNNDTEGVSGGKLQDRGVVMCGGG